MNEENRIVRDRFGSFLTTPYGLRTIFPNVVKCSPEVADLLIRNNARCHTQQE